MSFILQDFNFVHILRVTCGGGLGFFLRKGLQVKQNKTYLFNALEYMDLSVTTSGSSLRFGTMYRPPPSKDNKLTLCMFYNDFSTLLEHLAVVPGNLIVTGEFNFHVDDPSNSGAANFLDKLSSAGLDKRWLVLHINMATHLI